MRNAFAAEIAEIAGYDDKVVLLSGDIGNRLFNPFKEKFPNRFYNCGVAEANMTSMAAGMATCGLKPVTYTITPFNTTRCLEQIRVDVCYQNLPVVIVGVGAGLSYAGLGATHHSCEDIAFLRVLPNMTVICPGDAVEVRLALRAALEYGRPVYIRLGKKNEPVVHTTEPQFQIGKGIVVREGNDVCMLSTGNMLPEVLEAARLLDKNGVSARVVSLHTVKPLDLEILADAFQRFKIVATVEEHSLLGGLGSSVSEWAAGNRDYRSIHMAFGARDQFLHASGNQQNARKMSGLDASSIAERVQRGI